MADPEARNIEVHAIVDWVVAHPEWAAAAVFAVALSESLAVVGLVVPGATVMLAAGALIALGAMGFWSTALLAVAGAIAGDGISYWIGRRYRDQLREVWPFYRHPEWLSRGERFFRRHGGKSVVFGRFVGPVRAFVPIVAGMLGMRPVTFYTMNILSAIAWAPAYLLPGMAFGASLAVAGVVATRLAVLLLVIGALIWFVIWSGRALYRTLSPRATLMAQDLLAWAGRHPLGSKLIRGLLDPARPAPRTLLAMGALFLGAAWLFLGVLEDVVTGDPLVRADQGFYQLAQSLRTPWGDRVMVFVTELGDGMVIAVVAAVILAWLLWRRSWRAAGYWVAAIGFGQVAATLVKLVLQRPRPFSDLYNGLSTYAFPSGHATMSMVVYGFLAVLVAGTLPAARRWIAYVLAALLILIIAVSRLYLGAHWLSDVLGGLSLGLAWICLLGIAYYRHSLSAPRTMRGLPAVALLAFVLGGGWHVSGRYAIDLQRYAPRLEVHHLDAASWWRAGWRELPAYRQDLKGDFEQPLNVQYSGVLASLRAQLLAQGWRDPVPLSPASALHWLLPDSGLARLPLLPQVHDGRNESLVMIGPPDNRDAAAQSSADGNLLLLRLWRTGLVLDPGSVPLWVGSISIQEPKHILLLTLPVSAKEYDMPLETFDRSTNAPEHRLMKRPLDEHEQGSEWSGKVLLIRDE